MVCSQKLPKIGPIPVNLIKTSAIVHEDKNIR